MVAFRFDLICERSLLDHFPLGRRLIVLAHEACTRQDRLVGRAKTFKYADHFSASQVLFAARRQLL